MVLRKIFGGEMERLTGGWGEIVMTFWRMRFVLHVETFRRKEN
jgi:hypothetical protein